MKKILGLTIFIIFMCASNANAEQTVNCEELSMLPITSSGGTLTTTLNGVRYEIKNENGYVTHIENGKLKYTYNVNENLTVKTNCKKY